MSSSSTKLSFPGTFREAKMISKFTSFHFGTCCRFQLILGVFLRHTRSFFLHSSVIAIYTHQHSSVIAFPLSLQCHCERPSYASLRVLTFIVSTTQSLFFPVLFKDCFTLPIAIGIVRNDTSNLFRNSSQRHL